MKALKVLINIILDVLIVLFIISIAIALYSFIQTKIQNKNYSNFFGYTYFQILTGSMEKTINIDDIIFVRITDEIKENDIVSYESNDSVITHRVIEVLEDGYVTKGDNNNTDDGVIKKDKIIGKVIFIGKKWGKVRKMIMEPIVIIPFVSMVVLFGWYASLLKRKEI